MRLFLDAPTVLPFWLAQESDCLLMDKPPRVKMLQHACTSIADARFAELPSWVDEDAGKPHVVVPHPDLRSCPSRFTYHVASTAVSSNAFVAYASDFALASPEYCFVRMASELPLPSLVKLGCMLCASFTFDGDGGLAVRTFHATTANKLEAFVKKAPRVRGVKRARRALRWVRDGAASPAEIDVMLLLCLPGKLGGYGFELPELNGHIRLSRKACRMLGYENCYCDLLWRQKRIGLEYNSRAYHSGYRQTTHDEMRRTALENMGYSVAFMTTTQLYNTVTFDGIARSLAGSLGKRMRKPTSAQLAARNALREELLYSPSELLQCGPQGAVDRDQMFG